MANKYSIRVECGSCDWSVRKKGIISSDDTDYVQNLQFASISMLEHGTVHHHRVSLKSYLEYSYEHNAFFYATCDDCPWTLDADPERSNQLLRDLANVHRNTEKHCVQVREVYPTPED